jgi:UDP:flavonoid glycosyltransferase YjiC (YdhE family)
MPNILIITKGSYGDVFPFFAIATKLRERGHKVTFATRLENESVIKTLGFPVVNLDKIQNNQYKFLSQVNYRFLPENLHFEVEVLLNTAKTMGILPSFTISNAFIS